VRGVGFENKYQAMDQHHRPRVVTIIVGILIAYGGYRTIGMGMMALFFLVKWWSSPW
jgi:hypothetical protein